MEKIHGNIRFPVLKLIILNNEVSLLIDTRGSVNKDEFIFIETKIADVAIELINDNSYTIIDNKSKDELEALGMIINYEGVLINLVEDIIDKRD